MRIDVTVLHPLDDGSRIGQLAEDCFEALTRKTPAGWGVAEPASQRWQRHQLTELCRSGTPEPTWLVVVGDEPALPAVATVEVTPTATGIAERVRLTVGSAAPDTAAIDRLAAHVADVHPVRTMLASLHLGGRSGLIGSRFAGHPVPYGLLVGPQGVSDVGLDRVLSVPAPDVSILGPRENPSGWIRLAGERPDSPHMDDPYGVLSQAFTHLGMPPVVP